MVVVIVVEKESINEFETFLFFFSPTLSQVLSLISFTYFKMQTEHTHIYTLTSKSY